MPINIEPHQFIDPNTGRTCFRLCMGSGVEPAPTYTLALCQHNHLTEADAWECPEARGRIAGKPLSKTITELREEIKQLKRNLAAQYDRHRETNEALDKLVKENGRQKSNIEWLTKEVNSRPVWRSLKDVPTDELAEAILRLLTSRPDDGSRVNMF